MELLNKALRVMTKLEKALKAYYSLNNNQKRELAQTLCRFDMMPYNPDQIYLVESELADLEAEIINQHGGEIDTQELLKMFLDARTQIRSSYFPVFVTIYDNKIRLFDIEPFYSKYYYFQVIVLKLMRGVKLPDWIDDIPVVDDELSCYDWLLKINSIKEYKGYQVIIQIPSCPGHEKPSSFDFYFNDDEGIAKHFFVKNVQRGLEICTNSCTEVAIIGRARDFNKRVTDAIDAALEHLRKVEQAA